MYDHEEQEIDRLQDLLQRVYDDLKQTGAEDFMSQTVLDELKQNVDC